VTTSQSKKVGPWTVKSSIDVYDNPWVRVTDHAVLRPDGSPGQYGVVHFKNIAVGVLPIDEEGSVVLVGQHRFPLDSYSWELPEGGGPRGENALDAAKRELLEETGASAENWAPLLECDLSNSVTDERGVCFLAWGLRAGQATPDPEEALAYRKISFSALHDLVLTGEIRDSLTIMMVLSARAQAEAGRLPAEISNLILDKGKNRSGP
jgi:8-oxo-dGTP pyrophosphatase MutT (NUDIX family)